MKKIIIIFVSAVAIFLGGSLIYLKILKPYVIKPPAALSVDCQDCKAVVFLDGKKMGATPLKLDTVPSGESKLLLSDGAYTYEDEVTLTPKTRTVIRRGLGPSEIFSAGENIWLEKSDLGETVSILSNPIEAIVKVDGKELGKSPQTTETLSEGEHTIEIAKENYEGKAVKVTVLKGFKINIIFQLFPIPMPKSPSEIKLSETMDYKLLDLSTQNPLLFSDTMAWAKAVAYYIRTRKLDIKYNYFIDSFGKIYSEKGEIYLPKEKINLKDKTIIYLGKSDDKEVTVAAKVAIEGLAAGKEVKPENLANQVEVLETGTGWLRVRSEASLNGTEIGKVNVGEKYKFSEEVEGWYKITLSDGTTGWISSQYAKKLVTAEEPKSE
ncbi:hypothetical protein COT51_04050 [candidate division WWE3 bacterium CG08_land_8_20_14_0_20_41_15]|uniref:SH3b domain-containing protein n=1 Tax=candidate division WWE3 bacterium CG08_land_8_20_14_0_20_41_15 TaxID=1975086 RepID=A0A2H0X8M2_UNCKA|nr:MAG: hypothetical protein COT51_04050 [candidate division WWE3 bacterium CG08_land_8_20_14_0_20_41_15]